MVTGRIFAIKRFEIHDGDGLRTTVFFKGCPLRCKWCHNPESLSTAMQIACYTEKCVRCGRCVEACKSKVHSITNGEKHTDYRACTACGECLKTCPADALRLWGKTASVSEVVNEVVKDKLFYDKTGGGVTLSGGEPLVQHEFVRDLLVALKKEGISTAVDTCLFANRETVESVLPYVDTFLVDLKAFSPEVHKRLTGQDNGLILENITFLANEGAAIEFRVPLIIGINDGEMDGISDFLAKVPCKGVKILPYHDYAWDKYRALGYPAELPSAKIPTAEELERVRDTFRSKGIKVLTE